MPSSPRRHALALLLTAACALPACAAPQASDAAASYQLRLDSRLVVEDVTVTDAKGKPVPNLPATAFHVTDDKLPQAILNFRESSLDAPAPAPADPTLHTNATLLQNSGTIVAILIDPNTIELEDQLFLVIQIKRFLDLAPAGARIAIFRANNQGIPVLLQPPTTDRELLRRAFARSVPVLGRPSGSNFTNSLNVLANLADLFRTVPGNKALLWLSGRFPLYVPPGILLNNNRANAVERDVQLERTMQEARLAVYPIDVRGILAGGLAPVHVIDTAAAANDPSTVGTTPFSESSKISGQYDTMDGIARSTGGTAFYSNNSVATLMTSAIQLASTSYSLGYRPSAQAADGRWHPIKITVDGPYTLSYRTGYYATAETSFATETAAAAPNHRSPAAHSLTAPDRAPELTQAPVVFSARITSAPPASGKGKTSLIHIRYVIPTDQLAFQSGGQAHLRLAALAYNASGDILSNNLQLIDTHFDPDQMKLAQRIGTPADQTVEVKANAQFLLLAVEDLTSQKIGTLQLPIAAVTSSTAPADPQPAQ